MRHVTRVLIALAAVFVVCQSQAQGQMTTNVINYNFSGTVTSGSLIGQTIQGTFSLTTGAEQSPTLQRTSTELTIGAAAPTTQVNVPVCRNLNAVIVGCFNSAWQLRLEFRNADGIAFAPLLNAPLPLGNFSAGFFTIVNTNEQLALSIGIIPRDATLKEERQVTFSDAPASLSLDGEYGGIDWGGQWLVDDTQCGQCLPNVAYFNDSTGNCRDFTFVNPSLLTSFNAGVHTQDWEGVLTLEAFDADGNSVATFSDTVKNAECTRFDTGWTQYAKRVRVCFTLGWELAFTNLTYTTTSNPNPNL